MEQHGYCVLMLRVAAIADKAFERARAEAEDAALRQAMPEDLSSARGPVVIDGQEYDVVFSGRDLFNPIDLNAPRAEAR